MTARPESLGLSTGRLKHIDAFLDAKYVQTGKLPFVMTMVARKGEVAHHGFSGLMDEARGKAVEADSLVRIYSMTKPLTSVLFMMLVEEGKVALDQPVHTLIPSWKNLGVYAGGWDMMQSTPCARPMQMVDLLRHTSGLTYGFQQRTNVDAAYRKHNIGVIDKQISLDATIEALATLPLEFSPGEAWNYSVSTDILGYLIGKIEGKPFEQVLKDRLIDPPRHGRHRLPGEGQRAWPPRRLLRHQRQGRADPAGRSGEEPLPPAPRAGLRRRRAGLHRGRTI